LVDYFRDQVPDERGIYWSRTLNERSKIPDVWIAEKRFGANVMLHWSPGPGERVTDERWVTLDRVLSAITAP
jgi:hypothetical protein